MKIRPNKGFKSEWGNQTENVYDRNRLGLLSLSGPTLLIVFGIILTISLLLFVGIPMLIIGAIDRSTHTLPKQTNQNY